MGFLQLGNCLIDPLIKILRVFVYCLQLFSLVINC